MRPSSRWFLILVIISSLPAWAVPTITSVNPPQVILKPGAEVAIVVRAVGQAQQIKGVAQPGELVEQQILSPDEARFTYHPRSVHRPREALIVFWVEQSRGEAEIATVSIPLIGRTDLEVRTNPGAQVRVEVGHRIFGPRRADAQGRAAVPIEVPPGVRTARVLGQGRGQARAVSVPLDISETKALTAFIAPSPLPPGGKGFLWVVGAPQEDLSALHVAVEGGRARPLQSSADHRLFELTPNSRATSLKATAVLLGAKASATALVAEEPPDIGLAPLTASVLGTPEIRVSGFYGGPGENGVGVGVKLGLPLHAPEERLTFELGLGVDAFSLTFPRFGGTRETLYSWTFALPLEFSVRIRALRTDSWALDAVVGSGLIPLLQQIDFIRPRTEAGVGVEAFGGVQFARRLPSCEWFLELRGNYAPISSSTLNARLPGLSISLGLRNF